VLKNWRFHVEEACSFEMPCAQPILTRPNCREIRPGQFQRRTFKRGEKKMKTLCGAILVCAGFCLVIPSVAREPLASRIAHADPAKYRHNPAVHNGPGALDYMALFDFHSLDTNLYFLHRGVIEPKSGIGAHFHNACEEMFVIFDGEAQFTIDGRNLYSEGACRRLLPHGPLSRHL
jgi:hypothetical protein